MSKIIKKISASLILILMIFSVAFNVLDYGYKVYAAGTTHTITSSKFKLIINEETYNLMSESNWNIWLNYYDRYYDMLKEVTGHDPNISGLITINTTLASCTDSKVSNVPSSGWQGVTWANSTYGYNIELLQDNFQKEIRNSSRNMKIYGSYTLLHEMGHLFEYGTNVNLNYSSNIGTGSQNSPVNVFENEISAMLYTNDLIKRANLAGVYNGNGFYLSDYEWYNSRTGEGPYTMKYKLAAVMIELKNQVGLDSYTSVYSYINNNYNYSTYPQKLNIGSSERFNLFVDTISKLTNKDAWKILNNILNQHEMSTSTVESIMQDGGKIGTLKEDTETTITSIKVTGNKSNKDNTIDFKQGDESASITIQIKSDKQPKSVKIILGDQETTLTSPNSTSGDTYTYITTINVNSEATQESLISDRKIAVLVEDEDGNPTSQTRALTITTENIETTITSITVKGNKSNKANTIDYTQDDTEAIVTVVVKSNKEPRSVTIKLGDKQKTVTSSTKDGDNYTFTTKIDITETGTQKTLLNQKTVSVTATGANGKTTPTKEKSLKVEDETEAGKVEITEIQIKQQDSKDIGVFDSSLGDTVQIKFEVEGVTSKEDLKIRVNLKGFTFERK